MARLKPDEVSTLGKCENQSGPFSVLLLKADVDYDKGTRTITFDPNATCLLNVGSTDQILVLSSKEEKPPSVQPPSPSDEGGPTTAMTIEDDAPADLRPQDTKTDHHFLTRLATGDKLFLSELPDNLRGLGEMLLAEIRKIFPGELNFEPRSAKFDETPEIFWTVKILPSEKALRLTVRGTPQTFEPAAGIDLKQDRFGYSAFRITNTGQVQAALAVITQARKHMD
jgi:hypothetical protein